MSRIRDPARDGAYTLWKEAGGKKAPKGILIDIAERLNKNVSLIRKWKNLDDWEHTITNKNGNVTNKKKLLQKAKAMVVQGSTLKETSEKLGIPVSTLGEYSSRDNWIEQQEKFMRRVYKKLQDELCEEHIVEKKKAIKSLSYLKEKTLKDIIESSFENLKHYNIAIKNIGEATELQSKFLGLPEMKMYIRQDKEDKEEQEPVTIIDDIPRSNK